MNKELVSIIIPTYNSITFLPAALESIFNQTYSNFEVLMIDNLSTDGSLDYLTDYSIKDSRLKVFSEKDAGIYDAMNKGIAHAAGDWIYFMGADDCLADEHVLANIMNYLNEINDLIYGDSVWLPENIKESGEWKFETFIKANINHQRIFYKRKLFELYGAFNIKYKVAADHDLNIRFFCNDNIRKQYIPLIVAQYHSGGFSSLKTDIEFWEDWDDIILKNFAPYLSKKVIYGSLGIYIRYLIDHKKNGKALILLFKNFRHTCSLGFVKLMMQYFIKSKQLNAS